MPPSPESLDKPRSRRDRFGLFFLEPVRRSAGLLDMWFGSPARIAPDANRVLAVAAADADVRCILSLATALLGYGLPAHRVEESVLRLAHAFGRSATVFGLPTALTITLRGPAGIDMYAVRAQPGAIDLARLDALHHLVARVERKELDAEAADHEASRILRAPRSIARWVDLLAVAAVAFGGTLMLGGNVRDSAWSGALGLGVGLLLLMATRLPDASRVLPLSASLLVTLLSTGLAHLGLVTHPLVVAFAALLVLLPGLMLTLAMTELATGHLVSGTARSMGAVIVFLQLGLGVLFGVRLGGLPHAAISLLPPASLAPAASGALVLALGFAVLLAVRARDLLHTLSIAALSFFVCRFVGAALGVEIGVLVAACAVGFYSHVFARHYDRPSSTLTLPGVLMLVPGSLGLISVSAAALYDPTRAFEAGFQMLMVVIALSSGILFSAAALPPRSGL